MVAEANGGWAIDNDYHPLRDVLLGRPDYFEWHPISSIAKRTLQNAERMGFRFDRQSAVAQHREMVDIYEENGVACHFIDADEHLHLNVFARDSNCMTPFGPIVTHMQVKWRRPDYVTAIRFYQDAGIPIFKMVTAGHFEGGDFVIVEPGSVLIGYGGERSEEAGARQVAGWMEERGWETLVVPFPAHFVHMDAMLVPIAPMLCVICTDALEDYVAEWLKARGFEFVEVGYKECVKLGCNVVALGNARVLSMRTNADLNERLRALGFTVYDPDMSQFQMGGGGVHCLSQALRRFDA